MLYHKEVKSWSTAVFKWWINKKRIVCLSVTIFSRCHATYNGVKTLPHQPHDFHLSLVQYRQSTDLTPVIFYRVALPCPRAPCTTIIAILSQAYYASKQYQHNSLVLLWSSFTKIEHFILRRPKLQTQTLFMFRFVVKPNANSDAKFSINLSMFYVLTIFNIPSVR